jgi:hypothetical protein
VRQVQLLRDLSFRVQAANSVDETPMRGRLVAPPGQDDTTGIEVSRASKRVIGVEVGLREAELFGLKSKRFASR